MPYKCIPNHKGKIEKYHRDINNFATGVAEPCKEIHKNPELVFEYTKKRQDVVIAPSQSGPEVIQKEVNNSNGR
jgi:hypothetical protein